MAFTYLLTNDIGKIRLMIADTDSESYDFEDDEITAANTLSSDIFSASAMLLRSLAANRSRLAVSVKRGTMSEDLTKVSDSIIKIADKLEEQSSSQADISSLFEIVQTSDEFFSWKRNTLLDR